MGLNVRSAASAGRVVASAFAVQTTEGGGATFPVGAGLGNGSGIGWFLTGIYQKESGVRNRAEGGAFWLKAVVPF